MAKTDPPGEKGVSPNFYFGTPCKISEPYDKFNAGTDYYSKIIPFPVSISHVYIWFLFI